MIHQFGVTFIFELLSLIVATSGSIIQDMTIIFLWTKNSFLWKIWFSLNERPKQSLHLNFYNRYFYRITLIVLLLSCLFFVTHSNASSSLQDMTISFLWIKEPFDWKDMILCHVAGFSFKLFLATLVALDFTLVSQSVGRS